MKRILSVALVVFIFLSVCNGVFALDPNAKISRWFLSDGTKTFSVKPISLPKVSNNTSAGGIPSTLTISDLYVEMNMEDALPYLDSFNKGTPVQSIILYGVNTSDQAVLKITLTNNFISSFKTGKMLAGNLTDLTKAVVSFYIGKIVTQKVYGSSPAPIKLTSPLKKFNYGKIYLDNILLTDTLGISEIKAELNLSSHVSTGAGSYGPDYSAASLELNYNSVSNLPDWMANFDTQRHPAATTASPYHKIRYELSSTISNDKLAIEIDVTISGQEIFLSSDYYTYCRFSFVPTKISQAGSATTSVTRRILTTTNWAGKWDTSFGPMSLTQSGSNVTGTAGEQDEFTLKGTISLNKLTGTWSDGINDGSFQFTMSGDGKSFKGYMNDPSSGETAQYEWNGEKI